MGPLVWLEVPGTQDGALYGHLYADTGRIADCEDIGVNRWVRCPMSDDGNIIIQIDSNPLL